MSPDPRLVETVLIVPIDSCDGIMAVAFRLRLEYIRTPHDESQDSVLGTRRGSRTLRGGTFVSGGVQALQNSEFVARALMAGFE